MTSLIKFLPGRALSRSLLTLCGVAAGGFAARDFVLYAIRVNPFLNLGILLAMGVGAALVCWRAREFDVEAAAFAAGVEALRQRRREALGTLPGALMRRLFGRLARLGLADGAHLPEGSIDNELRIVRMEWNLRFEPLQYMVGLMVALGLLGTFIGLLETLVKATDVLSVVGKVNSTAPASEGDLFGNMVGALKGPLSSMGTAFSASMFGLVGSVLLGMMVILVRRVADGTLDHARGALFDLSDSSRALAKPTAAVTEEFLARFLTDLTEHNRSAAAMLGDILEASGRTFPAVSQVAASVELLAERMARQTEALAQFPQTLARLERLPEATDTVNNHLARIAASLAGQEAGQAAIGGRLQALALAQSEQAAGLLAVSEGQLASLGRIEAGQAPLRAVLDEIVMAARAASLAGTAIQGSVPAAIGRLEAALVRIDERLGRAHLLSQAQSELMRAEAGNEEHRVAGLRLLGDAVLASAGSVDAVRHELGNLVRNQRTLAGQHADMLKAVELAVARLQETLEEQKRAGRTLRAGPGPARPGD